MLFKIDNGILILKREITMNEKILEDFIKRFPIPKGSSKDPYIILFDAYTGMGKSTIALELAKKENAIILNNDEVRNFLNDYNDITNMKDSLQRYRLEKLLENNNNCIYDSCFCHNYESKLEYFKNLGYKYFIVRIDCSDKTVEERLAKRTVNEINYSIADYNGYLWMKNNVKRVPLELIDFVINNERELEPQIKKLLDYVHKH